MKKYLSILAAVAVITLVGCGETANRAQYQIGGAPTSSGAPAAFTAQERESLRQVIASVADRFKLQDMTGGSVIPGVFAHFRQFDAEYPVQLVGYTSATVGRDFVEVLQTHPYGGETDLYRHVQDALAEEIERQFPGRAQLTSGLKLLREKKHRLDEPQPEPSPAGQP